MTQDTVTPPEQISCMDECPFLEWEPAAAARPIDNTRSMAPGRFPEDQWVREAHLRRAPHRVHSLGCFHLQNVQLSGRGLLTLNGKLLIGSAVMPFYVLNSLRNTSFSELAEEAKLPIRTITSPVLVITGHGVNVYGHVLIETLCRLQLADALNIRADCPDIMVPINAPDWFRTILRRHFGALSEQLISFNPLEERILLTDAFVPTLPWAQGQFHPASACLFNAMRDRINVGLYAPSQNQIALTRQDFRNYASTQRSLQNEAELLSISRDEFGLSVIAPEMLSWHEQVALFTTADLIVGSFGSGLHNALFSRSKTKIAVFGFLNMVQSEIAALNGQVCYYVPQTASAGPFSADAFRTILSSWKEINAKG